MSNIGSYKTRTFSENQKFLVLDPATGTTSLVAGSSLVDYITPRLNSVIAETTRLAAENTDYAVGEIIQTSGSTSPGDNFAGVYLVVAAGDGDFPMINGNELLVIRGDEFLREQLISSDAGEGSDLVAHTGTTDTVTEALNNRVIRVSSRTEMKAYDVPAGYQFSLEEGGRSGLFVVKVGTTPADTQEGIYVVLANGNYAERITKNPLRLSWFGAVGDGSDEVQIMNAAAVMANSEGIQDLVFDSGKTYGLDAGTSSFGIPSNVHIDLNGSTLQRVGTNTTAQMVRNLNYGGTVDVSGAIRNGKIVGTGDTLGVSDQGAGIFWFKTDGYIIENIETDQTNGDGFGWRQGQNSIARNVTVGDYGRNGYSPTSGRGVYLEKVAIKGSPIAGANPGLAIDAENDSALETSGGVWVNVTAPNATFVDFYTAAGEPFGHEFSLIGCDFGPAFRALRLTSTNKTVARKFIIDASSVIRVGASNGFVVDNVSGVSLLSNIEKSDATSGTGIGIAIEGVVDGLHAIGVKTDPLLGNGLLVFDDGFELNNAIFRGCELGTVRLQGSNNIFEDGSCKGFTVVRSYSANNTIGTTFIPTSVSVLAGALLENINFGSERGNKSKSFYSQEFDVDGTTTSVTVNLPDASATSDGRVITYFAGHSHRGSTDEWAYHSGVVRLGNNAAPGEVIVLANGGGTAQSIGFNSATTNSLTLDVSVDFPGKLSVTVIG